MEPAIVEGASHLCNKNAVADPSPEIAFTRSARSQPPAVRTWNAAKQPVLRSRVLQTVGRMPDRGQTAGSLSSAERRLAMNRLQWLQVWGFHPGTFPDRR